MRNRRLLASILLFWAVVTPAYALFEFTAQKSLEWVIGKIDDFLPGELSYDSVEGALKSPIVLNKLRYRAPAVDLAVERLELRWHLPSLFTGDVRVELIQAREVEVRLGKAAPSPEEEPPSQPFTLPDIKLPIAIELQKAEVSAIRIYPAGAEAPVVVDRVDLAARTEETTLHLQTFEVQAPQGGVKLSGWLTPIGAYPVDLNLNWNFQDPKIGPLEGQGVVTGDLQELALKHAVSGALSAELDAKLRQVLNNPAWQAQFTVNAPEFGTFAPELAGSGLSGKLTTEGNLKDYRAEGAINTTSLPEVGAVDAGFALSGDAETLRISRLSLNAADSPMALNAQAVIDLVERTIDAGGEWRQLAWPLVGTPRVQSPEGRFAAKGTFQDYQLSLDTVVTGADFGTLNARVEAAGSDRMIRISELAVSVPDAETTLDIQGEFVFAELRFDADGKWNALRWPLIGPPQVESPNGSFSAQGTPKDYKAVLNAELIGPEREPLETRITAAGDDRAIEVSEIVLRAEDGAPSLNAQGRLSFADLGFTAAGEWKALVWPLSGEPQFESPGGVFEASGNIERYEFRLNTEVQGPALPQSRLDLSGEGSAEALDKAILTAKLLEGEINADLSARWKPQVRWQAALSGSDINPGAHWPQVPGKLKFQAQSRGELTEAGVQAQARLEELSGTLRDQPVQAKAVVAVAGQEIDVKTVSLHAGEARLDASGSIGKTLNLSWELLVPRLDALLPTATGIIRSSGKLSGSREQPKAELKLALNEFVLGDQRIQNLNGKAMLDLSGASQSQIDISASKLLLGGQHWETLSVEGGGTPVSHTLETGLDGDPGRLAVALEGRLQNEVWNGRLTRLAALDTVAGDWGLAQPVAIEASARRAEAEQICLDSRPSRLCVQGRWEAAEGAEGKLVVRAFDFSRFEALLPPGTRIDTRLNGEASIDTRADGSFQAQAALALEPGSLHYQAPGRTVVVNLQSGSIKAEANQRTAGGRLQLDLGEFGQLAGDLQVKDLNTRPLLDGVVTGAIEDLSIVSAFAPQVQNATGRLTADLKIAGAPPVPALRGEIRLVDAAAQIPEAALELEDIQMTAIGDQQGALQITGSARSGEGKLDLSGQLDPAGGQIQLNVAGQNFQAMNTPEVRVLISPNVNLSVGQGQLRIDGEVKVPEASLSPPRGVAAGGVSPSGDVVIVRDDSGAEPETEKSALATYVRLRVILGEDVRVAAPGFKAQLAGNLLVEQTPELAPRGTGTLEVQTGEYRVYGQDLQIERGRLLFSGGPIGNPGLDLRVSRQVEEVTAGAQVRGTVKKPELVLFSDPAMPDSSILSYLLFGRAPDARSSSESALLLKAASALGFGGGNLLGKQISDAVGLDYFQFDSGDDPTADSSLVLGKYLTPDLYISYGIGLFEAVNTFTLRYEISKKLTLESNTSGEQNSADLIYTIER